jgi:hypothetical protein
MPPDDPSPASGGVDEEEPPAEVLDMLRQEDASRTEADATGTGDVRRARTPAAPRAGAPGARTGSVHGEERTLCEHLAQGDSDPELASLVAENLPLAMLDDPLCRRFVEMALEARREGVTLGAYLERDSGGEEADEDDSLRAFAAALRTQPGRIKGSDYTRRDAVQDLILGFWRRHLQQERKRLALPPSESGGAAASRRIQLTMDLKLLEKWETGQDVILIERAMLAAAPADVPPVS